MSWLPEMNVLVTGGAGAFGQAFVAHALRQGARRVVVYSRDEAKHATMAAALKRDPRVRFFIGDVRDLDRLHWAMRGVDVVVHAAALKRVDTCEADPYEATQTNIIGSQNVALAAITACVRRAVLLSTDKAAAPCTLYGSTKAVAERAWIQSNGYADGTKTRLAATRYGNVLGSTGSVVPRWTELLTRGQQVLLSDPEATRFWMTMAHAVQLVETALSRMTGGETFVPRINGSSLLQLLEVLSAHMTPNPHADYTVTGLIAGEKAHETLIGVDEVPRTYYDLTSNLYTIAPAYATWAAQPPVGDRVSASLSYQSNDPVRRMSRVHLQQLLIAADLLPLYTRPHAPAPVNNP